VLLNSIRIVGPIIVGILIYVSVDVTAMKKKLMSSSRAHRKLNNTKLNNYFL
jgi:hypothetical protein